MHCKKNLTDDNCTRVGNLTWCSYLECKIEEREIDSLCCKEVAALWEKFEGVNISCITEVDEFRTLCLNKFVLENVLVGLHNSRGDFLENNISNRSFRFASYKQFTLWIYKYLGKGNRRVIPSCVLWRIRSKFPEPNGIYVLYREGAKD